MLRCLVAVLLFMGCFAIVNPKWMKCLEIALFPLCACALSYNAYLIPYSNDFRRRYSEKQKVIPRCM